MAEEEKTIAQLEFERLKKDSDILDYLRGAGVDNWEGYDLAMESYYADHPEELDD